MDKTEYERKVTYGDGMAPPNFMDDEVSASGSGGTGAGTYNSDALDASAEQKKRQEERNQRLQEIERTFQRVVEESHAKEEDIYNNVFRSGGDVFNEEHIRATESQIMQKQSMLSRVKGMVSRKNDALVYPFQVQSPSAVGDFDDLPGFLPPDDFGVSSGGGGGGNEKKARGRGHKGNKRRKDRGNRKRRDRGSGSGSGKASMGSTAVVNMKGSDPMEFLRQHRYSLIFLLLFCFGIAVAITIFDFGGAPPPLDIPQETWDNLEDVRDNLVGQGVRKEPLYNLSSPQFSAVKQLAEEVTLGELHVSSSSGKGHLKPGVVGEVFSASTDREILERYALLTLYYSTTTPTEKWKMNVNWKRNDKNICDGWYNVQCKEIQEGLSVTKTNVVTTLTLKDNGLVGTIPEELAHLSSLETLHLDSNDLEGGVPASLGNLKELKSLRLSFNKLTGRVPNEVCDLNTNAMLLEIEVSCANLECKCCECL